MAQNVKLFHQEPQVVNVIAEVYGPNYKGQIKAGETSSDILHNRWCCRYRLTVEANQTEYKPVVEKKKGAEQPQQIVGNLTYLRRNILFLFV
jgi:DNA-directed RNA polymerase subunit N (RpoN/RPB10)